MKNSTFFLFAGLVVSGLCSCASHHQLVGMERTRIVVDSRYDNGKESRAEAFIAPYKHQVDSVMSPVAGVAARDMAVFQPESELSNLLSDILMWAAKDYHEDPDFAVYNIGGIRAALSKGTITYGDIIDVAPFDNKICFLTLSGDKVLELFETFAFQGGQGVSHGVNLVISKEGKLLSAALHGKAIDPQAKYRIATIDYLANGGDRMVAFNSKTDFVSPQDVSNNTRFIIINYFKEKHAHGQIVDAKIEGRTIIRK